MMVASKVFSLFLRRRWLPAAATFRRSAGCRIAFHRPLSNGSLDRSRPTFFPLPPYMYRLDCITFELSSFSHRGHKTPRHPSLLYLSLVPTNNRTLQCFSLYSFFVVFLIRSLKCCYRYIEKEKRPSHIIDRRRRRSFFFINLQAAAC